VFSVRSGQAFVFMRLFISDYYLIVHLSVTVRNLCWVSKDKARIAERPDRSNCISKPCRLLNMLFLWSYTWERSSVIVDTDWYQAGRIFYQFLRKCFSLAISSGDHLIVYLQYTLRLFFFECLSRNRIARATHIRAKRIVASPRSRARGNRSRMRSATWASTVTRTGLERGHGDPVISLHRFFADHGAYGLTVIRRQRAQPARARFTLRSPLLPPPATFLRQIILQHSVLRYHSFIYRHVT